MSEELRKRIVWSATPTPFTDEMQVDTSDVGRLVEHHIRLGVEGLMLAGTCGEGPWMVPGEQEKLVRAARDAAGGRLELAVQVSDNSADRIVRNAEAAARQGAGYAVIAPPYFLLNATPANVLSLYRDAIRRSPLPVIIYDIGGRQVTVADEILEEIYSEPKVVMVKDSSDSRKRREIALRVREARPELVLTTGDEFKSAQHLEEGYDGMLLGGAVISGAMCRRIANAADSGNWSQAQDWQKIVNEVLYTVYGGHDVKCWLAGLKYALVRLGVFTTTNHYLNYPLTADCKRGIDDLVASNKEWLLPETAHA